MMTYNFTRRHGKDMNMELARPGSFLQVKHRFQPHIESSHPHFRAERLRQHDMKEEIEDTPFKLMALFPVVNDDKDIDIEALMTPILYVSHIA